MSVFIINFLIGAIIGFIGWVVYLYQKIKEEQKKSSDLNKRLCDYVVQKNEHLGKLQKMFADESAQAVGYRKRVLELEDGIQESHGITLRNEITKVVTNFNEHEMFAMSSGLRELIQRDYVQISTIKFYIELIEKLEKYMKDIMKSKEPPPLPSDQV